MGPVLPVALYSHAIAAINESVYIVTGGCTAKPETQLWRLEGSLTGTTCTLSKTYYYYGERKIWVPGPDLKVGRSGHAVGVVTDRVTLEKYVLVVGGRYGNTEIILPGADEWKTGT